MRRIAFPIAMFSLATFAGSMLSAPGASVKAATAEPAPGLLLFRDKGCEHCHGASLEGSDKGPNLTGVGRRLTHEQIEHQIRDGGDNMPPFGDVLEAPEITLLTDYLSHQKSKKPATAVARSK